MFMLVWSAGWLRGRAGRTGTQWETRATRSGSTENVCKGLLYPRYKDMIGNAQPQHCHTETYFTFDVSPITRTVGVLE